MSSTLYLLGKVFISHSSIDQPFARRLADAIEHEGYPTWLDERELLPGDALASKLSEAIDTARVMLVIVSSASVQSRWLAFELNKATVRMVEGTCRVIPVVIEKVTLPPEVGGLLYSDFTDNFDLPLQGIIRALAHDAQNQAWNHSFWSRAEWMVNKVFPSTGFISISGEYKSEDYNVVYLYPDSEADRDASAAYEVVSGYSSPERPLTELWWTEYSNSISSVAESLFFVLTERPIDFDVQVALGHDSRIRFRTLGWKEHIYGYVVFLELPPNTPQPDQIELVEQAKSLLQMFYTELSKANERTDG